MSDAWPPDLPPDSVVADTVCDVCQLVMVPVRVSDIIDPDVCIVCPDCEGAFEGDEEVEYRLWVGKGALAGR